MSQIKLPKPRLLKSSTISPPPTSGLLRKPKAAQKTTKKAGPQIQQELPQLVAEMAWMANPPISPSVQAYLASQPVQWPLVDLRQHGEGEANLNSQLTDFLAKAIQHIKAETTITTDPKTKKSNPHRIRSISKGIETLTHHPEVITSGAQAQKLPGIGAGIARRIDEILQTGRLGELDSINDNYVRLILELTKITGIGLVKARKLIDEHQITGIDDLIAKYKSGVVKLGKNQLTHHQIIGIKYAKDLEEKIPRAEIEAIEPILEEAVKSVDPKLVFQICGSYRRGKAISGDIDVLVSHPSLLTKEQIKDRPESYLLQIVEQLFECGLLIDSLTEEGRTKYMGVCQLTQDHPARRIDIRFLAYDSYPAGLLYFTGSGQFNQIFRGWALMRKYTVNEYGIYPLVEMEVEDPETGEIGIEIVKGDPVTVYSEADIFAVVGVKYLNPQEREF